MQSRWSKDQIALEILRLYSAREPLNYGHMQQHNIRLLRAATRYFGSWKNAIEFAGLDYESIRRYKTWTNERIIEKIRSYHQAGHDLSWRHVSTQLDPSLAAAAIRKQHFGNWKLALEAAGLDYEEIRKHRNWSGEDIQAEIRRMHESGESLRVSDVCQTRPDLVAAARRHFDGWYEAIIATGIDEWEARRGLNDDYDDLLIRGEISWSETQTVGS